MAKKKQHQQVPINTLKLGDTFFSSELGVETGSGDPMPFVLHDVIVDKDNNAWAIGIDEDGVPYTVYNGNIDPIKFEVTLPSKGRR